MSDGIKKNKLIHISQFKFLVLHFPGTAAIISKHGDTRVCVAIAKSQVRKGTRDVRARIVPSTPLHHLLSLRHATPYMFRVWSLHAGYYTLSMELSAASHSILPIHARQRNSELALQVNQVNSVCLHGNRVKLHDATLQTYFEMVAHPPVP